MSWNNITPAWMLEEPKQKENMSNYDPTLTPAEYERLALLSEEAGEIVQAVGKTQRHGYGATNPLDPNHKGNRDDLTREVADIVAVIIFMVGAGDIDVDLLDEYLQSKLERLANGTYLHHQKDILETAKANSR